MGQDMKKLLVMTVCGVDLPGTIDTLVTAQNDLGAEILSSKVMRLEGQMAAIMKIAVVESQEKSFATGLSERFPNLQFLYSPVSGIAENTKVAKKVNVVVDCKNRPGIQSELNDILQGLSFHVEKMEHTLCRVANIGETLFSARCELRVPENLSSEAVADEIEALTADARVNVV
jgi:glycine cleavage system regulatory protein